MSVNEKIHVNINGKEIIEKAGLIVILRGVEEDQLNELLPALYDGGVRIIEIAFNPSDKDTVRKTTSLIRRSVEIMGDKMFIGAGTVVSLEFAAAAHEAGAGFIFSPNTDAEIIHLTKKLGMVSIPGAYTPSECMTAYNNGADLIKLFPITENDIDYLINIMRPLSHIPFICVGGVNENSVEKFIKAGAVGVGTGISIIMPDKLKDKDYAAITDLAKKHTEAVRRAKELYCKNIK